MDYMSELHKNMQFGVLNMCGLEDAISTSGSY